MMRGHVEFKWSPGLFNGDVTNLMNKVPQIAYFLFSTSRFATRFIILRLVFIIKYLLQDAPWIAVRLMQEPYC